ncbi:uncharacterized protein VTP21DRAFT_1134 [Calcarisporiella thermophila]|uniref:uncharacterized protein n=1 Tax=Calcarisporiella thermophila TaxID=911321 RepID=UPI00374388B2
MLAMTPKTIGLLVFALCLLIFAEASSSILTQQELKQWIEKNGVNRGLPHFFFWRRQAPSSEGNDSNVEGDPTTLTSDPTEDERAESAESSLQTSSAPTGTIPTTASSSVDNSPKTTSANSETSPPTSSGPSSSPPSSVSDASSSSSRTLTSSSPMTSPSGSTSEISATSRLDAATSTAFTTATQVYIPPQQATSPTSLPSQDVVLVTIVAPNGSVATITSPRPAGIHVPTLIGSAKNSQPVMSGTIVCLALAIAPYYL